MNAKKICDWMDEWANNDEYESVYTFLGKLFVVVVSMPLAVPFYWFMKLIAAIQEKGESDVRSTD